MELTFYPDGAHLGVKDNGVGFNFTGARANGGQGGFGLVGMQERVLLLGGTFTVSSPNGGGTLVEARVPTNQGEVKVKPFQEG